MPLDEGLLEHSQMAHGPDSRGGDLVNPDRSCGVVLDKDGELRFVTGDELSALSGSDALLMEDLVSITHEVARSFGRNRR